MARAAKALGSIAGIGAGIASLIPGYGWIIAIALTAAAVGLNYLAQSTLPKPPPSGFQGTIRSGGAVPRSFIHGHWATAGSLVYAGTSDYQNNTPNFTLTQIIALSDLPVTGMAGLIVNGEAVTWDPGANTISAPGEPWDGFVSIPEFDGFLFVKFYDGTQTAADAWAVAKFGSDPDRPWTSAAVGYGVANAVVLCHVNDELYSGVPELKFVLDGIPLYELRNDTTAGGSGSQRWATPSTWGGDDDGNPITLLYNLLRGVTYGGKYFYGLQNTAAARLPFASWAAGGNACDVPIALKAGGTEKTARCGGEILVNEEPANVIAEILASCNGRLAEIGGIYKVQVGAATPAVMSFTDDAVLVTEANSFDPFPSLADTINGVTARYISIADSWAWKDAPPRYSATLEAEDGNRRLLASYNYGRVTAPTQVQRLMSAALKEARRFRRHVLPMPPDFWLLEPVDFVSWTSVRNGYTTKLFRVDLVDDLDNLDVALALTEVDPSDYDWTPASDELDHPADPIQIKRPPPQAIIDWSASGINVEGRAGILLSWDPDVGDVDGVRFQVRRQSDSVVILDSQTDAWAAGSIKISHNIAHATTYEVRGKYRPANPRQTTYSGWLAVTTPDVAPWDPDFESLGRFAQDQAAQLRALMAALLGDATQFSQLEALRQIVRVQYLDFTAQLNTVAFSAASNKEVLAGQITQLGASYNSTVDANATALQGLTVRITNTEDGIEAVSQSLTALEATLGGDLAGTLAAHSVAIDLLQSNVSDINGVVTAQALQITQLSSQVGDSTANGLIAFQTTANQGGARARLALRVRASTAEGFSEGAMIVESIAGASGNKSRIGFVADQFYLTDTVGGVAKFPFVYAAGKLTLNTDIQINGDLVVAGSITENGIKIGALGDMQISIINAITTGGQGVWTTLCQADVQVDAGGAVFMDGIVFTRPQTLSQTFQARIIRKSDSKQFFISDVFTVAVNQALGTQVSFAADLAPKTGVERYMLQIAGTGSTAFVVNGQIRCNSQKRARRAS